MMKIQKKMRVKNRILKDIFKKWTGTNTMFIWLEVVYKKVSNKVFDAFCNLFFYKLNYWSGLTKNPS